MGRRRRGHRRRRPRRAGVPLRHPRAHGCGAGAERRCYGVEIADALVDVDLLASGVVRRVPAADLGLAYRTSVLKGRSDAVVLRAEFALPGDGPANPSATPSWPGPCVERGTGRPPPRCARPCSACAAARAWCSTRPTTTPGARARSSPTPCWRRSRWARRAGRWAIGVKVSAAWLIEHAGFRRGIRGRGRVALSSATFWPLPTVAPVARPICWRWRPRSATACRRGSGCAGAGAGAGRVLPVTS